MLLNILAGTTLAEPPHHHEPIETHLPRIDPLSAAESAETFDIAAGFRVELVAAEPLVVDPVAFCFDATGRLIVVEMRGYSERRESHTGRVRRLTDTDADGRMDRAETLFEGLAWPTAVAAWRGGVLIAAAPDIFYVPPTESVQTPEPQVWFRGFGTSNVQGLVNSFRWGNDLRLHGATSSAGGEITGPTLTNPVHLGRRDFAIEMRERRLTPIAGGGQHGMSFDRWGNKFVSSNSDHLQQVLTLTPRPQRATRYAHVPPLRWSIAQDGPQAEVFRRSPVEPWRVLRTHMRVHGLASGPIEGGGRAAGYFTGATGVTIYDGDQWPASDAPTALVADVGSNLIHRKRLARKGLWYAGHRIDKDDEFLRSTDIWFRPVQLGTGPDGALYITDMYREVIEHPKSLPPTIKSQLDLNSGNDRGRIWRVVAEGRSIRREPPRLDGLENEKLVELLAHPNTWHRRTAARLLLERNATEAIPQIRQLARTANRPEGRLQSLQLLAAWEEGIDGSTILAALTDDHHEIRQRAVEIASNHMARLGPLEAGLLEKLATDPAISVRFQLAYHALTLIPQPQSRGTFLARVAARDLHDPWIRWAIEGSLTEAVSEFHAELEVIITADGKPIPQEWIDSVVCQQLHTDVGQGHSQLVANLQAELESRSNSSHFIDAVVSQLDGLSSTAEGKPLAEWVRQALKPKLEQHLDNEQFSATDGTRLQLVRWAEPQVATSWLDELLGAQHPQQIQRLALNNLYGGDRAASEVIVKHLSRLQSDVAHEAIEVLAEYQQGLAAIAREIQRDRLAAEIVPQTIRERLLDSHRDQVAAAFVELSGQSGDPSDWSADIQRKYAQALQTPGDFDRGQEIFAKHCGNCHALDDRSAIVGPNLRSVANKSPQQLLLSITEPDAEVDPRYRLVQIVTITGRVLSGVVAHENESSVTIIDTEAKSITIPRDLIDTQDTTIRSAMPSGLYKEIPPEAMRDLIAFLRAQQPLAESVQPQNNAEE